MKVYRVVGKYKRSNQRFDFEVRGYTQAQAIERAYEFLNGRAAEYISFLEVR